MNVPSDNTNALCEQHEYRLASDPEHQRLSLAERAFETEASDLHLIVGYRPVLRRHGVLTPLDEEEVLTAESIGALLAPIMTEEQQQTIASAKNFDFALNSLRK